MLIRCLLFMLLLYAGCQTREKVEPLSNVRAEARMTSPISPPPARETNGPAPKLRVAWEPASNLAFISLTVANEGPRPVTVDPQLQFTLGGSANDPRLGDVIWPLADEPGTVQVVLTSARSNGQPRGWSVLMPSRPQARPVVLAPGETRAIKVPVDSYALNLTGKADDPNQVVFSLRYDEKELTVHAVVRRGRPWKRWQNEAVLSSLSVEPQG